MVGPTKKADAREVAAATATVVMGTTDANDRRTLLYQVRVHLLPVRVPIEPPNTAVAIEAGPMRPGTTARKHIAVTATEAIAGPKPSVPPARPPGDALEIKIHQVAP